MKLWVDAAAGTRTAVGEVHANDLPVTAPGDGPVEGKGVGKGVDGIDGGMDGAPHPKAGITEAK